MTGHGATSGTATFLTKKQLCLDVAKQHRTQKNELALARKNDVKMWIWIAVRCQVAVNNNQHEPKELSTHDYVLRGLLFFGMLCSSLHTTLFRLAFTVVI